MNNCNTETYYLISSTEGCATNLYENSSYEQHLNSLGLRRVPLPELANYIIVNTCGYSNIMQERSEKIICDLKSKYSDEKIIIVGGCYPGMDKEKFNTKINLPIFPPGDLISLQKNIGRVSSENQAPPSYEGSSFDISDTQHLSKMHKLLLFMRSIYFSIERSLGVIFQPLHNIIETSIVNNSYSPILTGTGCQGQCTFCAIKIVKGKIKSRPLSLIMDSIKINLENNKRNIWLLGDDIGCWGQDIDSNSTELLSSILSQKEISKLVITYFDPEWLEKYYQQLLPILNNARVVNINFPIQSGSNRLIKEMNRYYDIDSVLQKIKELKRRRNELAIKTNFIVGFPGETWVDFFYTIKALFYFDAVFINRYGRVKNTQAFRRNDQVHPLLIHSRFYILWSIANLRHAYVTIKSLFNINKGSNE